MSYKRPPTVMAYGCLVIFLACLHSSHGLEGRMFYLSFMNISTDKALPQPSIQEIFITSDSDGRVRIVYNSPLNYTEVVQLNSANDRRYVKRISPTDLASPINTQLNVAIVISATMSISVQANKAETGTGDGYLALPITTQSRQFYLASYSPFVPMQTTFSIISPFNDTCVSISYVNGKSGYRMMHLTMQENDAYNAASPDFDYTGVYVSSSRPIAVFSGHSCAMVPNNTLYCDHLIEQVPPVSQWGRSFIMSSFWGRPYAVGFRVRVVAQGKINATFSYQTFDASNNPSTWTVIRTVSLDKGQWEEEAFERLSTTNAIVAMVNCSDNCLVMQYDTSFQVLGAGGPGEKALPDPFMITALPLDHYQNNIRFSTSRHFKNGSSYECVNGMTIVAKKSETSRIYFDGIPLDSIGGVRYNISASDWSAYTVIITSLKEGFHSVTTPDPSVLYAVYVYGYGTEDHTGYGYLGGYRYIYGDNDKPVDNSNPRDFLLPSEIATQAPAATTIAPVSPVINDTDTPYYILRFTGRYYAFELRGNLITKFCSDGYARYFNEKRLEKMKSNIGRYISSYCSGPGSSISASVTSFIYSEYTAGVIEITVRLKGVRSTRLRDLLTCVRGNGLSNIFENLSNWVDRYNNSRDVLKNDTDYTKDCNVVHFLPEKFISTGTGWVCPQGTESAVSASSITSLSIFCACAAALLHWVTDRLRLTTNAN